MDLEKSYLKTILKSNERFILTDDFRFYFLQELEEEILVPLLESGILKRDKNTPPFIEVPKNFITDFGSVPLIFQNIISPVGKPTKAYVLHDFLCVLSKKGKIDRKIADLLLKEACLALGVSKLKSFVIYYAVRFFVKIRYFGK
ncbi:hypothetical protein B6S12_03975 [Helicobacter valdiviensis]|uniref:DUF1353 domain-containing protein n=1 Tax=Helicobacter valdiviensis TaxID=1458358 RepID=A0A2W6MVG2_9HELI|nr:DUF1353 domain-containing protein [Helicobacter valdiviensis]PZT48495.1 hypothetical protein B6S12_03975 [Helicobacter valdiviensis]